jgi:clorobiocin biosynthesis protein CloN3
MDFELTAEQRKRYADTLEAVRSRLGHLSETEGSFTREQWGETARLGLAGLCLPEEHGGGGLGALDTALCLEAFGRGCPDTGLVFAVCAHLLAGGVAVRDFASAAVRSNTLSGLATGQFIAANAITEDAAGSDVGRLRVTARREGDDYVLDGEKSFASNAPAADVLVTYAATSPGDGFLGVSAFLVDRHLPGVSVSEPLAKMGLRSCPAGRVRFRQCRLPASYRLGEEGQGSAIFAHAMAWERACLFAAYVGLMDDQLERCVTQARTRRQFGRPIGDFQAISHRIATMKQRLESARLLLYRACWLLDREQALPVRGDAVPPGDTPDPDGPPGDTPDRDGPAPARLPAAIALSKVAVSEASVANSLDAIQIFGGTGYLTSTGIERYLRDSVPSTLFSGTTEIQREIIAREAGL